MSEDQRIDVALITRERRDDLTDALDAIVADLGPGDRLFVLENGCSQRSTAGLEGRFPDGHFSRSDENLGVPGGRNAVAALGEAPIIAFIDDDAILSPGSLDQVAKAFAGHPDVAVVAFRINDPGTGHPRSHEFPFKRVADEDVERDTTYFVGAGFAVRRDVFERLGGFDGRLFYGMEELDLSYRVVADGGRIRYLPTATVDHRAAPAGRPSGQKVYYLARNRMVVAWRHLPGRFLASQATLWGGFMLGRALRHGSLRHFTRGVRDGIAMARETERHPLEPGAVHFLQEHDGRLWY